MDSDAVRKRRLEEIEAKKKRLEEMRRARGAGASVASSSSETSSPLPPVPAIPVPVPIPVPEAATATAVPAPSVAAVDTDALVSSLLANMSAPSPDNNSSSNTNINNTSAASSSSSGGVSRSNAERFKSFGTARAGGAVHVLPSAAVRYDKGCQTEDEDWAFARTDIDALAAETELVSPRKSSAQRRTHSLGGVSLSTQKTHTTHAQSDAETAHQPIGPRSLSELDKSLILCDPQFLSFLDSAALHVERALEFSERFDVLRDYAADAAGEDRESAALQVVSRCEEDALQGRPVTHICWSALLPELFLVAYGARGSNVSISATGGARSAPLPHTQTAGEDDIPGVVCVWSRDMLSRAEMKFHAPSPVLAALFHPQESQLIVGSCYNGQILLWDMRTRKNSPVQRSSLTAGSAHKQPVYCLAFQASALAVELLSVSVDGMLCVWDVSRLTEPVSSVFLTLSPQRSLAQDLSSLLQSPGFDKTMSSQSLSACCLSLEHGENGSFAIVGSGAGQLMRAPLPFKPLGRENRQTEAHYGLVTSVAVHPMSSHKYRHLALSCSLDWTIKLWNTQSLSQPVYEFVSPTCDYVCDVQWSPVHAALFATITSSGKLCLWNLSRSVTEPLEIFSVLRAEETRKSGAAVALNRLVWTRDGQNVLVGDSAGVVHRVKLQANYAIPSAGEESKLEMLLHMSEPLSIKPKPEEDVLIE